jgi:hypothetical protein
VVQGFITEEVPADAYEAITCLACRQNHFVNPATGKVLREDGDDYDRVENPPKARLRKKVR